MPTLQAGHIMLLGVFARPFSNRMWEHAKIPVIEPFELHDAFSIMAARSLEACDFAARGQGPRLALDGKSAQLDVFQLARPAD